MSEVEMNEDELFNSAVSDETTEAPIVTEEPVVEQQEQTATTEEAAEKVEPELTAEKPPIPPKPEWRLKEDAERARAAETELANGRAENAALRQRLEALERPKVEQAKPAKPDPLLDPDGYEAYLEAKVEEKLLNNHRENSMATAHGKYKQEFEEAMSVATKQIDPALKARMQNSRDPGEELMRWHREEKAKAEVGTDLPAYKARLREEALKDPEFLAKAVDAARIITQPPSNGRPRIDLPPSLNGASRSGSALRSADGDVSDHELFEQTIG